MELYIKNMVCNRCIAAVQAVFKDLNIVPSSVELGVVRLDNDLPDSLRPALSAKLISAGFELIDDRRHRIANRVRTAIIERVHYSDETTRKENLSDYLSRLVGMDYGTVAELFSSVHGMTVEKYYIAQKIERVKELLVYDEWSLSEIAELMGYSSVAHLSAQFKRVTGVTPSVFRKQHLSRRPLDEI